MSPDFYNIDGGVEINSPDFTESGKNKVKAICDAGQALQIATRLDHNDRERDIRRSKVLAAFNGAAPYCESDLIAKAQSYRYNVSFGYIEGVIGRAVVPYNELTINISDLTEIEANLNDEKLKIIQSEFSNIMRKWGRWPKFVTRMNQDLVLNGYNCAIFPSDYDPFPIFVPQKEGFVDEGSTNDVNDLELFVWKKSYLIHELYAKISDADVAKKAGWNVDNVREALMSAQSQMLGVGNTSASGSWTEVESAIRGGSLWASIVGAKKIDTYHVFASEIEGKVTHYIVIDQQDKNQGDGPELFKKEERFDAMRDFLVYLDLETGDGSWHGSRGIGQRAFNTHKAIDKLRNSALDQTFVSGLTILQPGDQVSQEELTLAVVGPFAVIPAGLTVGATTLPAVSTQTFTMDALLSNTSEQRIGDVVPQPQSVSQIAQTATQARISAGRQELITRGNLKRYVDPVSQIISIIVRRLLKDNSPNAYAKEFQKELKRKGLSDDDLKEIRGARNTGNIEDILGNTAQGTQVIFAEFRGDPEIDQENLKRRRISSVLDADAADELLISDQDQTKQIESARMQEMEITTMQTGEEVPVSPRDNHEIHIQVILQTAGKIVQAQAQNLNPDVIPFLRILVEHGGKHLNFMKSDKANKAMTKQLEERLKLVVDAIKEIDKNARKLAEGAINAAAKIAKTPEEQAQVQQAQAQLEQPQPQSV